jgi:hypothetical protein
VSREVHGSNVQGPKSKVCDISASLGFSRDFQVDYENEHDDEEQGDTLLGFKPSTRQHLGKRGRFC